jgi:2-haloacid dehalogenase
MTRQPAAIIFDVNETLSDLSSVADAFEHVGAARSLAATWFASILRDGFALTTSGSDARFEEIAANNARDLLSTSALRGDLDDAVHTVMTAFAHVSPHPDVAVGLHALHDAGHQLFTLSNGPTTTAERLLEEAGARETMDQLLTVEGHSPWKPARSAYADAATRIGSDRPSYLAAVHPWDIHGAARGGLFTIWINRSDRQYPAHFEPPTITVATLGEIAARL